MNLMCESHERTSHPYISICTQAGLKYEKAIPVNALQTLLAFRK
ncbi:MAG: hypothetical protein ACUVRD_09215 [Bacteroidia bacterium]